MHTEQQKPIITPHTSTETDAHALVILVLSWYVRCLTQADVFKAPMLEIVQRHTFFLWLKDGLVALSCLFL